MSSLAHYIDALVECHGTLREVSRLTGIEAGYLSRLRSGARVNPTDAVLRLLQLRRVVTYEPLPKKRRARAQG